MKSVALPKHDDSIRALLIEGPYYDSYAVYVPCTLSNGKEIRLCVASSEGLGLHIRRQPVLLLNGKTGPEVALATMHIKRIAHTKNISNLPHLFTDERAYIDIHRDMPDDYTPSKRRARIAYEYPQQQQRQGKYATGFTLRQLFISADRISHPDLDNVPRSVLDEAYQSLSSAETSWSKLCEEHNSRKLHIDLPGIDLYLKYERQHGLTLPKFYGHILKTTAGSSSSLDLSRKLEKPRHELVAFIEMLSGMKNMLMDSVSISYDGVVPTVEFEKNGLCLNLYVNELPVLGNFLVVDRAQETFEKKFVSYETLAQAITAITTRMTYE